MPQGLGNNTVKPISFSRALEGYQTDLFVLPRSSQPLFPFFFRRCLLHSPLCVCPNPDIPPHHDTLSLPVHPPPADHLAFVFSSHQFSSQLVVCPLMGPDTHHFFNFVYLTAASFLLHHPFVPSPNIFGMISLTAIMSPNNRLSLSASRQPFHPT
jgi:hypothetical protein